MNKQLFVNRLNDKSKYEVNLKYARELIENIEREKEELKREIIKITAVDPADKKAMLNYLNEFGFRISKYTNTALQELLNDTGNKLFEMLLSFNRKVDKHIKLNSFYNNIETVEKTVKIDNEENVRKTAYISPTFALNSKEAVSISKPSLPFSIDEIKSILGYRYAIQLNSLEDIAGLLKKYSALINQEANVSNFLIINTTIYLNLDYFLDVDLQMDAEFKKTKKYALLKEFVENYGNQQDFPIEIKKPEVKVNEIEADTIEDFFARLEEIEEKAVELKEEVFAVGEEEYPINVAFSNSISKMMDIINGKRKALDKVLEEGRKEREKERLKRENMSQAEHVVNVMSGWNFVIDRLNTQNNHCFN